MPGAGGETAERRYADSLRAARRPISLARAARIAAFRRLRTCDEFPDKPGPPRLDSRGEIGWFQYESTSRMCSRRRGFDIVIGNPPWVRAEKLPPCAEHLSGRYSWWRSPRERRGYRTTRPGRCLSERSHELSARWMGSPLVQPRSVGRYATVARRALASDSPFTPSATWSPPTGGLDATVYPMAWSPAEKCRDQINMSAWNWPPAGRHPRMNLPGVGRGSSGGRRGRDRPGSCASLPFDPASIRSNWA